MGLIKHWFRGMLLNLLVALPFSPGGWMCTTASVHAATDKLSAKGQNVQQIAAPTTIIPPFQDRLEALSRAAEETYDLARGEKWNKIGKKLDGLKTCEQNLNPVQHEESAVFVPQLNKTMAELQVAISTKNRMDAMRLANKITLIEAAMAGPLGPRVPTSVGLLDYYGRELEIWTAMKNADRLSYTVLRMHLTWQNLLPKLSMKNETKEIKKFAEIMNRLEMAKTTDDYSRLITQVRDEVNNLEKIFRNEATHFKRGYTK